MSRPTTFGQFARALRELAKVPAQVSRLGAQDITKLMRKNVGAGLDPYARAYAPLTAGSIARGRRPPPLRKFRRTLSAKPMSGGGIAMHADHPQAGFHQTGTSRMAKRIVLPDGALPAAWREALKKRLTQAVKARLT